MDIGSGLTIQTRTINGRPTAGIFFGNNSGRNARDKSRPKYPIRSTVDAADNPKNATNKTTKNPLRNSIPKIQEIKSGLKQKSKDIRVQSGKSTLSGPTNKTTTDKNQAKKTRRPVAPASHSKKPAAKPENQPQDTDTKYVTLTQGQLNTILSLVKSKNDVDISNVFLEKEKENGNDAGPKVDDKEGENGEEREKSPQGGDKNKDGSRPTSTTVESGKEGSVTNLLKEDKNTEKKAAETKEKGLDEEEKNEKPDSGNGRFFQADLPAAIRSSFFVGEGAPRDHAFSAKKREEQRIWREELDKQRTEQKQKKDKERNLRMKSEEYDSWTKHFDTMLPGKNSPREGGDSARITQEDTSSASNASPSNDSRSKRGNINNNSNTVDDAVNEAGNDGQTGMNFSAPMPSAGIGYSGRKAPGADSDTGDFASTLSNNAVPQRSSYLRTMTSLLDPAQIEALEVKRRKQEEHRRAIGEQVEERKRKKEEEEERRRRQEAEEDQKMAAERDSQAQKTEVEKLRHEMKESVREQKTQELYQHMKDAEESALREKQSKREQILKKRGHDTSRLEKAHQLTLETTRKVTDHRPLAQASQTSIASTTSMVSAIPPPPDGYVSNNLTPRQVINVGGHGHAPLAVTAQTDQGPIQLEISLNQRRGNQLVESAVQTEDRIGDARHYQTHDYDSDADTEYMRLPPKTRNAGQKERKGKTVRLKDFECGLDRQYERHSRTDRNALETQPRQKKIENRPKWGVAEKHKNFVPASKRYTAEQQRHDALLRKERQPMNEPERSRGMSQSQANNPSTSQPYSRPKSPVVPAARNRQKKDLPKRPPNMKDGNKERPSSGIYATGEQAKYRSEKHTRDSPVPETKEFVQYRRTTAVLDPNQAQSGPETGPMGSRTELVQRQDRQLQGGAGNGDPLLNPGLFRQHERQDQILKEISILRQGLLIKQREVASYPAGMTHSMAILSPSGVAPTNLVLAGGGNLPERTNDTPVM